MGSIVKKLNGWCWSICVMGNLVIVGDSRGLLIAVVKSLTVWKIVKKIKTIEVAAVNLSLGSDKDINMSMSRGRDMDGDMSSSRDSSSRDSNGDINGRDINSMCGSKDMSNRDISMSSMSNVNSMSMSNRDINGDISMSNRDMSNRDSNSISNVSSNGDDCCGVEDDDEEEDDGLVRRIEVGWGMHGVVGVCYFDGRCVLVDVLRGKVVQELEGAETEAKSVAFDGMGRLAVSTRSGSIWIWRQSETGEWEIEEIIEYSESDVKTVLWYKGVLFSCGYAEEIVLYSVWSDEMCGVKWEIDCILKEVSTVWDMVVVEWLEVGYLGAVLQNGDLVIYKEDGGDWKLSSRLSVSNHPIIAMCSCWVGDEPMFAMVINRYTLGLFKVTGELYWEKRVLEEEEEPMDIVWSQEGDCFLVLSTQMRRGERTSLVRQVMMS
ncbi:hypothetical protein NEHOM01_2060 [Nematocida homosporus]|uniref:uncharacterized protein n=1 Tax=Nematocida homosporus TaxID=1912981 RepID=UPI00221FCF0F|nr:uncharacterized protein NEHOM01_2060 [Nematocida homosporus]KAI5187275.1 hypothetical protein NEHOM01_2060 [Nematocida homosporus]